MRSAHSKVPTYRNTFLLDLETSQQSSAAEKRVFIFRRRTYDEKEGCEKRERLKGFFCSLSLKTVKRGGAKREETLKYSRRGVTLPAPLLHL